MKVRLLRWLLVIAWMAVIFLASSSSNPYRVLPAGWTGRCAQIIPWESLAQSICQNGFSGNLSHMFEYAVLGYLFNRALDSPARKAEAPDRSAVQLLNNQKGSFIAFIATVLFALSDEVHQIFIPGRAFQIFDLCLDVTGAVVGTLFYRIVVVQRRANRLVRIKPIGKPPH